MQLKIEEVNNDNNTVKGLKEHKNESGSKAVANRLRVIWD